MSEDLHIIRCGDCHNEYARQFKGQLCPYCVDDRKIQALECRVETLKLRIKELCPKHTTGGGPCYCDISEN